MTTGKSTNLLRAVALGLVGVIIGMTLWGPVAEYFGPNDGAVRLIFVCAAIVFLIGLVIRGQRSNH
jgi:hypothetical protein